MKRFETIADDPRVTVRRAGEPDGDGHVVVYWMQRAQRALDNPALETAIRAANAIAKPVVVFFGLVPHYPNGNLRHYHFLVEGLKDVAGRLAKKAVGFVFRCYPDHRIDEFCNQVRACLLVGDENPVREPERWRRVVAERLRVPFWTVDADVIVPAKLLGREHYAARTIRPHIHAQLDRFLVPIRNSKVRVAWKPKRSLHSLAPDTGALEKLNLDRSARPVPELEAGTSQARRVLRRFVRDRLRGYAKQRNRPEQDGTSQLSPYLHFGQIGPHTVALAVRRADAPEEDKRAFLEELIVRRELAVNFVRFNPDYDSLAGCEPWAQRTLRKHTRDRRPYLYTVDQLEAADTHDPLWNAAQQQMVKTGWMHGYLRMYWAKKILQWTPSPEVAFDIAVSLNDRYELDGRDPNGYAGVAWAIGGKHDRAWGPERPVFGTIRYMSYESTSRKFDAQAYIEKTSASQAQGGAL